MLAIKVMLTLPVIADIFYDSTYVETIIFSKKFHLFTYLIDVVSIHLSAYRDMFKLKKVFLKINKYCLNYP